MALVLAWWFCLLGLHWLLAWKLDGQVWLWLAVAAPAVVGGTVWLALRVAPIKGRPRGSPVAAAALHDPVARTRIRRLLEKRRSADALAAYIAALAAQPRFDPGTVAVVPLTKQALKQQRPDLALQLLEAFGQRRPGDTRTALYRWLHGQALLAAGREDEGVAQLQALMLHHAGDRHAREARTLLAHHHHASGTPSSAGDRGDGAPA
ncbi:tol-pal system YbgF family protein [Piscinibacter sp. HJYY11]|uniref:tetratricopeptide repeat protein n=1 Tax=Piscinibacter sp. HJYY11 TaxID=2801333 RepID=UPI00191FF5F5|nr:hypothetical protein [Piscinibacter sp. HJYY11]MBL0728834.1 hypothetical protein [Piscinibacter sp. HJYY11]